MLHRLLQQRLQQAVATLVPDADPAQIQVHPCPNPRFGDYQTSALMALAKARKMNPRQLATDVLARLDVQEWCDRVELAGGGFLNFQLRPAALAQVLQSAARGEHLFFEPAAAPRTVVVDFSSPNVAKPMHVGHIRSTILGDCLARTLRLLGHRVITDNHIGDWGTQFGMLLVGWKRDLDPAALQAEPLAEMERIYKTIRQRIDQEAESEIRARCRAQIESHKSRGLSVSANDEEVIEKEIRATFPKNKPLDISETDRASRRELVDLQDGDAKNLGIWRQMIGLSQAQFDAVYGRLGVRFDHTLGESFYNPRLKAVVDDLVHRGLARESEGAKVVFFENLPELKNHPAIIQKSDGAANYTTTDLATLAHRLEAWRPDEIIYVTDGRQQLHFKQLFAVFRQWRPEARIKLAHVWFGSILGEDGKPFKTRSGDTVRLADLLDEAEERAFAVVSEKNPELAEPERREIARVVGLGAVKYADLLPNRQSDYVFSWDKMLALNGNTAPYLLYAHTRIRSIFRKGGLEGPAPGNAADMPFTLGAPEELALGKHLLHFGHVLEAVTEEYRPNYLCNYLYELAGLFARFYENCPVLKAEEPDRAARLRLCDLTARVLKQGLAVLGIETPEQM